MIEKITNSTGEIVVRSTYLPHRIEHPPQIVVTPFSPDTVTNRDINSRGRALVNFPGSRNLEMLNKESVPTYLTPNTQTIIDLTLCSTELARSVSTWLTRMTGKAELKGAHRNKVQKATVLFGYAKGRLGAGGIDENKESAEVDKTENSKTFNHVAEQAELNRIEKNIRQPILCMSNKMNFSTEVERGSYTNNQEINKIYSTEAEKKKKNFKNDKDNEINIINVTVLKEATGKENISNDIKDNVEPMIKDVCTHLS
ncbi:hypothetical protein JTB14_023741 [Gonioctena quinquepunctata]|nr:hypothetical protein JTB14_023741 [Gonioctena quinquepunctata]